MLTTLAYAAFPNNGSSVYFHSRALSGPVPCSFFVPYISYPEVSPNPVTCMDWRRAGPGQSQTVKHILVNIKEVCKLADNKPPYPIHSFIHPFISVSHHYECVAPNVDIILQSGWFWATSVASFRERFSDSRCCWVVFIYVVYGAVPVVSSSSPRGSC